MFSGSLRLPALFAQLHTTLGGHTHTVSVPDQTSTHSEKKTDVDIGFMVMNRDNYPNLTRLFELLDVKLIDSDMR